MYNELILIFTQYPYLADQKFWLASGSALAILGLIGIIAALRQKSEVAIMPPRRAVRFTVALTLVVAIGFVTASLIA